MEGTAASYEVARKSMVTLLTFFVKKDDKKTLEEYETRFNYIQAPEFWKECLANAAIEFKQGIISIDEYQEKTEHFLTLKEEPK